MGKVTELAEYSDDRGNSIAFDGTLGGKISITFKGRNNRIIAPKGARIEYLNVNFDCDNGTLILGANTEVGGIKAAIRIGQDATVKFGDNVNMTGHCMITAVEGCTVSFGDDVMMAQENQFRTDDAHPIFDVTTGKRINTARDVTIGNHVWFANGAVALAGARVGDGSVIGFRSLVTGKISNNCIAVGSPARVTRRNIAWERPHLSLVPPFYKPDVSTVEKSAYWALTEGDEPVVRRRTLVRRLRDASVAFTR
ncbi:transferase hexapeptide (six repeat-containing protein) [Micromonospora coriariae]|uniref:Transferase hexapeptide (Six repeat-containing protein) n=1 Tax=Micromonospora coriariae TaxID=285665 RepID=A0A1C4W0J8_9ACTN|nr:acyltransferase [Micromonospora coriariae]SCE89763.1 transferase hexapeptide (six repeat-containing protein) [Micromonospora coriariae]